MNTLGHEFPNEMARVREVVAAYKDIGAAGAFGLAMILPVLQQAEKAWAEQDTVAMVKLYDRLKNIE